MLLNRSDILFYYQFEGNTNDSIAINNGTVIGTELYTPSMSGMGFDFNGATYIDTGIDASLLDNTKPFTMLLRGRFINYEEENQDKVFIACREKGENQEGFILQYLDSANTIRLGVRNAANTSSNFAEITATTVNEEDYAVICAGFYPNNKIFISNFSLKGFSNTTETLIPSESSWSNSNNVGNIFIGSTSPTNSISNMDRDLDTICFLQGEVSDEDIYRFYMGLGLTDL